MPKNNKITTITQTKKNKATPNNGKELGLQLGSKLGKSLISGLVPVLIGAVSKAALGAFVPGPHTGNTLAVSAPAARGTNTRTGNPQMRTSGNGNCVIKHREYIADVVSELNGYDLQFQYGINPGNPALFPWLSQLATRFDCYKFRRLAIIYEPQTSSTTTGTVMLAADYDASDPPPTSKVEMMSYKSAVRSVPWAGCTMVCSSGDLHRLKTNYVLMGTPPPNTDIKTYDVGNLYIAIATDATPGTFCGELYVEYDVELLTPQITTEVPSASIYSGGTRAGLGTEGYIFGDAPQLQGPLPVLIDNDNSTGTYYCNLTIQLPGYYIMSLSAYQITEPTIIVGSDDAIVVNIAANSVGDATAETNQQMVIFQVIDGSQVQISLTYGSADPASSCYANITPFSSSALPNFNLVGPQVIVNDLRMRLGRRRTIRS